MGSVIEFLAELRSDGLSVFRRAVDQDAIPHLDRQKVQHAIALEFHTQDHRGNVKLISL